MLSLGSAIGPNLSMSLVSKGNPPRFRAGSLREKEKALSRSLKEAAKGLCGQIFVRSARPLCGSQSNPIRPSNTSLRVHRWEAVRLDRGAAGNEDSNDQGLLNAHSGFLHKLLDQLSHIHWR